MSRVTLTLVVVAGEAHQYPDAGTREEQLISMHRQVLSSKMAANILRGMADELDPPQPPYNPNKWTITNSTGIASGAITSSKLSPTAFTDAYMAGKKNEVLDE